MVGNGTSTSNIVAHAIFADGLRNLVAGASANDIKRGLDRAKRVVEALNELSRPVASRKKKEQVATISAHNGPRSVRSLRTPIDKVGGEGVITVEEAKTTKTALEVVEGMKFDRGFITPYFVTNAERMEAVLENALIQIVDGKVACTKRTDDRTTLRKTRVPQQLGK